MSATHLITGVGGQDGILLARLLRARGHRVVGTTPPGASPRPRTYLEGVELVEHDVRDVDVFGHLLEKVRPTAVHNLAALSSVESSWDEPSSVAAVNQDAVEGMLSVLLAQRDSAPAFIQASTSEIFGQVEGGVARESTPLNPQSPYAVAKAAAHRAVVSARERGLRATNLVLFGHTGPLQDRRFVLPTLAHRAAEVRLGRRDHISLRDPSVRRDWGAAQDFVRAFVAAVEAEPGDFVVATGRTHALAEVAAWALPAEVQESGLTRTGEAARPCDLSGHRGDFTRAMRVLGWRPTTSLRMTIQQMVEVAVQRLKSGVEDDVRYLETVSQP